MRPLQIAILGPLVLSACTGPSASNTSTKEPLLKAVALTQNSAPAPKRVELPAWFKDETLKARIASALPAPLNMDNFESLKDALTWPREHGRFLRGVFINPTDQKSYNYTVWIHPDGGLTLTLPRSELIIEPYQGKWKYFPIDPDSKHPAQGGDIPK
jgi:hypothetical protein